MNKYLKKLIVLLLILSLSLGCFAGCGENSSAVSDIISSITGTEESEGYPIATGLEYSLNADKTGYVVVGIGDEQESSFQIPSEYKSLPVTSIAEGAFKNNNDLINIVIPSSVTEIWDDAFERCLYLEFIDVDKNNQVYSSEDGVLFNKDKTELIKYPSSKNSQGYEIPASVAIICEDAFNYCCRLESVVIPASVAEIEQNAFAYYTFYGYAAKLNIFVETTDGEIIFGENWNGDCTVYYDVDESNFLAQDGLYYMIDGINAKVVGKYLYAVDVATFVTINDKQYTVTAIEDGAVSMGFVQIASDEIQIPNSIYKNIDGVVPDFMRLIVADCNGVNGYDVENYAYYIEDNSVVYMDHGDSVYLIKANVEGDFEIPSEYNGKDVIAYYYYAFSSCTNLRSLTYSEKYQGENFLTSRFLSLMFPACLEYISVHEDNETLSSKDGVLYDKEMTELLWIPENYKATEYMLPATVEIINYIVFFDMFTSITVEEGSDNYKDAEGVIFSADGSDLVYYSIHKTDISYVVPESVENIGSLAFYDCDNLQNIIISSNVTNIGSTAFRDCDNLTIYCEIDEEQSSEAWDASWNSSKCPVYYAGEWSLVDGVPVAN
ncbi:MAG: leucine-rich repeat protein [Bacillota bacterium]